MALSSMIGIAYIGEYRMAAKVEVLNTHKALSTTYC